MSPVATSMSTGSLRSSGSQLHTAHSPQDEEESEIEELATLLNRTRQKKFVKYFKQLPSEELVLQRYSCALVGDILLQGHLYVTENYIAFHSNVFGYVTRIQIPMISVAGITKEKTAKIIPNAVGVTTIEEETHMFSSLISREATFKVMTKAWKKALAKNDLTTVDGVVVATEELEDDECVEQEQLDEESTDSMVSASPQLPSAAFQRQESDSRSPYLIKRKSNTGSIFYHTRQVSPPPSSPTAAAMIHASNASGGVAGGGAGKGKLHQFFVSILTVSPSNRLLTFLTLLLVCLLSSSVYLLLRLDQIQERVDGFLPSYPGNMRQVSNWQQVLHSQSSKKVQEYLDTNLQQISQVRKNLEKLASLLTQQEKEEF